MTRQIKLEPQRVVELVDSRDGDDVDLSRLFSAISHDVIAARLVKFLLAAVARKIIRLDRLSVWRSHRAKVKQSSAMLRALKNMAAALPGVM